MDWVMADRGDFCKDPGDKQREPENKEQEGMKEGRVERGMIG